MPPKPYENYAQINGNKPLSKFLNSTLPQVLRLGLVLGGGITSLVGIMENDRELAMNGTLASAFFYCQFKREESRELKQSEDRTPKTDREAKTKCEAVLFY